MMIGDKQTTDLEVTAAVAAAGDYFSSDASPSRRGPIRSLILGGGLLILAIVLGTAVMIDNFRERALNSTKRELENTVLLLARHFDQQMQDWMIVQNDLIDHIKSLNITTPADFRRKMSTQAVHDIIMAKIAALPDVGSVNVFDSTGQMLNSSRLWPVKNINVSDRKYFQTFASNPASPTAIIEPMHSRVTQAWTTNILRKITSPTGEFLGVLTRGVEPAHFEKFFESLSLGHNSSVSLFYSDGTLLARFPHKDDMIGKNFINGPLFTGVLSAGSHGTKRFISPVDGIDRIGAIRRLENTPFVVIAATTVKAALSDWAEQTKMLIAVACLASIVIAVLLLLVVKRLQQQHRAQQQRLLLEKQRLDTAINNMRPGLLLFDSSQRLIISNRRYVEMFNMPPGVMKPGWLFRDLIEYRKSIGSFQGDIDEYCKRVLSGIERGATFINETPGERVVQITVQPVGDGGWVSTHEDITERRRAEERIAYLARYDALTDLPNRTLFRERLDTILRALPADQKLAVLYIDIDQFKEVNDTLGHQVGDELLKIVAARLNECVGDAGFVARLGGDEFAIVLQNMSTREEVEQVISRIYVALRARFACLGHFLTSDASIGVAFAPDNGTELEQLLKNADLAMYAAKGQGRRTHRFFEANMEFRAQNRRLLEEELRQTIADGGLAIHYQPLVDIRSGTVAGFEALVRWQHPERGFISPAEFVPIAEEAGLIDQLGCWVLTKACAEAVTWPSHIHLAVNVSPIQFKQPTFALKVASALATSGLPPARLELEITEAVLISDEALAILHDLRSLGIRIALDDFGTGYSSLSYLARFPFDKIKIDRSFVNGIEEREFSSSIVQAIVSIAAARNIVTTAEGVETEAELKKIRELGCDQIQGYLFSRPLPASELAGRFFADKMDLAI